MRDMRDMQDMQDVRDMRDMQDVHDVCDMQDMCDIHNMHGMLVCPSRVSTLCQPCTFPPCPTGRQPVRKHALVFVMFSSYWFARAATGQSPIVWRGCQQ